MSPELTDFYLCGILFLPGFPGCNYVTAFNWGSSERKIQDGAAHLTNRWCCLWLGGLWLSPTELLVLLHVRVTSSRVSGEYSKGMKAELQGVLRPPTQTSYNITSATFFWSKLIGWTRCNGLGSGGWWVKRLHFCNGGTATWLHRQMRTREVELGSCSTIYSADSLSSAVRPSEALQCIQ